MNVKRKIENALIKICEKKPLDDVTVTEIAQKAGLTRQVFYKYFFDKYELANWIHIDDYYSVLQKDHITEMDWFTFVEGWLTHVQEHKKFYQNVYYSPSEKQYQKLVEKRVFDSYVEIIETNINKKMTDEMLFCLDVYCQGGCNKISDWILTNSNISPKQLCHLLYISMPKNIQEVLADIPFPKSVVNEINSFRFEKVSK